MATFIIYFNLVFVVVLWVAGTNGSAWVFRPEWLVAGMVATVWYHWQLFRITTGLSARFKWLRIIAGIGVLVFAVALIYCAITPVAAWADMRLLLQIQKVLYFVFGLSIAFLILRYVVLFELNIRNRIY